MTSPTPARVVVASDVPGLFRAVCRALSGPGGVERQVHVEEATGDEVGEARVLLADPARARGIAEANGGRMPAEWVQSTYAGVNELMDPSLPRDYALTRVGGVFGPMMAEYVVGWVVAVERGLVSMDRAQARRAWEREQHAHYRTMDKLTVGVLGALGNIGTVVSERLAAMGSSVLGLVRPGRTLPDPRTSPLAGYEEELPRLLQRCDMVVNLLPSTPETRGLLDGGVLRNCAARQPLVINVGRGDVISEESVLEALQEEWVSRFVLDVFPQEPLRAESPLWDHPSVSITPHVAAVSAAEDVIGLFVDNLRRYLAGGAPELLHRVDFSRGY